MRFKKFLSAVCASTLLFSSIFRCKAVPPVYRVMGAFVGDSGTGKTSICERLIGENFKEEVPSTVFSPIVGIFFGDVRTNLYIVDNNDISFEIWDTPGQGTNQPSLKNYLTNYAVVCICLDVYKNDYIQKLNYWCRYVNESPSPNAKKIIVLNKTDLCDQSRIDTAKQAIRSAHNDIPENQIIPCSAKTNGGINGLKVSIFNIIESSLGYQQYQQEQLRRQQERLGQQRKKNLEIGCLVAAGIVTIGCGARAVYKRLTSNDKDKKVSADNLKKSSTKNTVTA